MTDDFGMSAITFEVSDDEDGGHSVWMLIDGEPFADFTQEQALDLAEALQAAAWAATLAEAGVLADTESETEH